MRFVTCRLQNQTHLTNLWLLISNNTELKCHSCPFLPIRHTFLDDLTSTEFGKSFSYLVPNIWSTLSVEITFSCSSYFQVSPQILPIQLILSSILTHPATGSDSPDILHSVFATDADWKKKEKLTLCALVFLYHCYQHATTVLHNCINVKVDIETTGCTLGAFS